MLSALFEIIQFTALAQMLSTERNSVADKNENDPDPRQFHNWEGTGAAQILLPDVTEKKFSAKKRSRKCALF